MNDGAKMEQNRVFSKIQKSIYRLFGSIVFPERNACDYGLGDFGLGSSPVSRTKIASSENSVLFFYSRLSQSQKPVVPSRNHGLFLCPRRTFFQTKRFFTSLSLPKRLFSISEQTRSLREKDCLFRKKDYLSSSSKMFSGFLHFSFKHFKWQNTC